MDLQAKLQLAYSKIKSAQKMLVVGHVLPDADAISSVGAIISLGLSLGVKTSAFCGQKPERVFDFIPYSEKISSTLLEDLNTFDVVVILDCGAISRTALEPQIRSLLAESGSRPFLIEIDHHKQQESYADLEIRLADKASTTEIIYQLLLANNLPITKPMADCILIGLMSDTGHFLHSNSSREALEVASEMLLSGASLPNIISHTVNNKNLAALKIWGHALDSLQLNRETGLATVAFSAHKMASLLQVVGKDFDTEVFGDIASFVSRLEGVRVSLLLREGDGLVKGSLRTVHDDIDVASIAGNFGGGGHKKAAGFAISGHLEPTANGFKVVRDKQI